MKLPIRLILNTDPPKFKWTQEIETLAGRSTVEHEGTVMLSMEGALMELIDLAERQAKELATLKRRVEGPDGLMDIMATQAKHNEELKKQIETMKSQPVKIIPTKKG